MRSCTGNVHRCILRISIYSVHRCIASMHRKKGEHRCTYVLPISLLSLFTPFFISFSVTHPFFRAASLILLTFPLLLYARKVTMRFGNLTLLHQLAEEYNQLINSTLSSYAPKELSSFEEEYDSIGINNNDGGDDDEDDDEVDNKLEEIEDEMMMMMMVSSGSKRRRIDLPERRPKKRKKTYDTKKCSSPIQLPWSGQYSPLNTVYGTVTMLLIRVLNGRNGVNYFENVLECHTMHS